MHVVHYLHVRRTLSPCASLIYAEGGKVKPFDFVSYADILGMMDKKGGVVMIHMEDYPKILPSKGRILPTAKL